MYFVYLIECSDKSIYTGITTDVERRFKEHQAGIGSAYTRSRRVVRILHTENFNTRSEALKREAAIKRLTKTEKLNLIKDMAVQKEKQRCPWVTPDDKLYQSYHDKEWGVPLRDDKKLFEFLVLEVFQAGLSWRTVLYKRENFRRAFKNFDFTKVAKFGAKDLNRLLNDASIIRNRAKIEAAINNAQRVIEIRKEFGTFSKYMWSWVGNKTIVNKIKNAKGYKPFNKEAEAWAKDLKKRGFKFLGPTVIYAHMQAVGMVNDHIVTCFRYKS